MCNAAPTSELGRLGKSRTGEARLVERAKIVLRCLAGERNDELAALLGTRPATVGAWRQRFAQHGLAGLKDRPHSGKPPNLPADLRQRLVRQLEAPLPKGFSSWDGGNLAAALGVSDDAVWGILRQDGIQLRRQLSCEHRPAVCRQGRRHRWPVSGSTAQRPGGLCRREALDPGLATQDGLRILDFSIDGSSIRAFLAPGGPFIAPSAVAADHPPWADRQSLVRPFRCIPF